MSFMPHSCNYLPYTHGCCHCNHGTFRMATKTAIEWATQNPVLAAGECVYESDTGLWKIGNGTSQYTHLKYQNATSPTPLSYASKHVAPRKGGSRTKKRIR